MIQMPSDLEYWTADQVSECLSISSQLSGKLWKFSDDSENPTPLGGDGSDGTVEVPDGLLDLSNDDKAGHWWGKLTEEEQAEIVTAYQKDFGDRQED